MRAQGNIGLRHYTLFLLEDACHSSFTHLGTSRAQELHNELFSYYSIVSNVWDLDLDEPQGNGEGHWQGPPSPENK